MVAHRQLLDHHQSQTSGSRLLNTGSGGCRMAGSRVLRREANAYSAVDRSAQPKTGSLTVVFHLKAPTQFVACASTFSTASAVSRMSVSDKVGCTRNMSDVSPSSLATGKRRAGRISGGKAFSK